MEKQFLSRAIVGALATVILAGLTWEANPDFTFLPALIGGFYIGFNTSAYIIFSDLPKRR